MLLTDGAQAKGEPIDATDARRRLAQEGARGRDIIATEFVRRKDR